MYIPMTLYKTYFHMFICLQYDFFSKIFVKFIGYWLMRFFIFLLLSFKSSFYILNNNILLYVSFASVFS